MIFDGQLFFLKVNDNVWLHQTSQTDHVGAVQLVLMVLHLYIPEIFSGLCFCEVLGMHSIPFLFYTANPPLV